jgi:hypothetical protein
MHQQSPGLCLVLSLVGLCLACASTAAPSAPATLSPARINVVEAPADTAAPRAPACELETSSEPPPPWISEIRHSLARALSSRKLPDVEQLLYSSVVITSYPYFTTETLEQSAAADWLRARAGDGLRVKQVQPHHQIPVVLAVTDGWSLDTPDSGCLTFYFHRYAPSGALDEDSGDWKIDVLGPE